MKLTPVGRRGVIFELEPSGSSIYLIQAKKKVFLCDTDEGPLSMEPIKQYIESHQLGEKELVVFNSHSDFDHIWGNCAFAEATFVAHTECKSRMIERGEFELKVVPQEYQNGKVELKLPNLTFEQKLVFEDEGVEFDYAPGHTIDSAICFDREDSVVYLGDLVDEPLPYLNYFDLEKYVETLLFVKSLRAKTYITAHSGIVEEKLIDSNIAYIKKFAEGNPMEMNDELAQHIHSANLRNYEIVKCDHLAKVRLGDRFDFMRHRGELWGLLNRGDGGRKLWDVRELAVEDVRGVLQEYIERIEG